MKFELFLDFSEYLENNWLLKNILWYEGAASGFPATNNGLETTNAVFRNTRCFKNAFQLRSFCTQSQVSYAVSRKLEVLHVLVVNIWL